MTLTQSDSPDLAASSQGPKAHTPVRGMALLDRDHSILAFNERVLDWAYRQDVPLIERLRYLCIVSSNLDEFFEVRAEPHLAASQAVETKGVFTVESFEKLAAAAHSLVNRQYALYTRVRHQIQDFIDFHSSASMKSTT